MASYRRARALVTGLLLVAFVVQPAVALDGDVQVGGSLTELEAMTADGDTWRLSELTDDVVVLHVCGLWCTPCRDVAADLAAALPGLEAEFGVGTFEVVEVLMTGTDPFAPSDQAHAQAWRANHSGPDMTVLHASGDVSSDVWQLPAQLHINEFPSFVVLDRHRRLVDVVRNTQADPVRRAIVAGLTVGELPDDLSHDSTAGPDAWTVGDDVSTGGVFGTGDDDHVAYLDGLPWGDDTYAVLQTGRPRTGSVDWWHREVPVGADVRHVVRDRVGSASRSPQRRRHADDGGVEIELVRRVHA